MEDAGGATSGGGGSARKRSTSESVEIDLEGILGRLGNLQHAEPDEQVSKFVEVVGCNLQEAKVRARAAPGCSNVCRVCKCAFFFVLFVGVPSCCNRRRRARRAFG